MSSLRDARAPGSGGAAEAQSAEPMTNPFPKAKALDGARPERRTLSEDGAVGRKFRLLAKLEERADVIVYDAEHTGIGRRVELHMLPIGLAADGEEADRLIHAARAGARVAHRHIRSVVDSGVDAFGRPFIVYEPLEGLSAAAYVRSKGGKLEPEAAAELTCQLLEALVAAHAGGVVHRQLNDDNVVITDLPGVGPRVKIGGFGSAFLRHRPDHVPALPKGYSRYLAPELRRGEDGTLETVDIFAAGVLMRLLLTGDTRESAAIAPVLARTVDRATAPDPDERFATAEQFLTAVSMMLTSGDQPGVSIRPGTDPSALGLTADLRYLQRRRARASCQPGSGTGGHDLELLAVLLVIEALYARLGDQGWGELARRVPDVLKLLPDSAESETFAAQGVPNRLVAKVLEVADGLCGDGLLSLVVVVGDAVAERGLHRLCPSLPDEIDVSVLVASVPLLWRAMSRAGDVEMLTVTGSSARIVVRRQRDPSLEVAGLFAGILRGALRRLAGDTAQVSASSSQALGDAADIYALSW